MITTVIWWLFWGAFGLILYTYIGFPVLVALRGLIAPRRVKCGGDTPNVSIIIAAYNEAEVITNKLDNLLKLDYPRQQLEIIVASDGSDDGTNELVLRFKAPEVRLLALPRQGKNLTVNAAVASAKGDILVFSDADSMLAPDALRHLVAPFADPEVGGVGGDYRHANNGVEAAGERAYWNYDRILKEMQSRAGSVTSVSGALYAIRRSLHTPLPSGVTDDFYTAAQVVAAHYRMILELRARAFGPVAESPQAEFNRKVRIIARGLRGVWLSRRLLNPFKYGFFSLQLLSHKVLRRVMVLPLILLFFAAPALWQLGWIYQLATLGQLLLHGMAAIGFWLYKSGMRQPRLLRLPFFFDMVNAAALSAIVRVLKGERRDIWATPRSALEAVASLEQGDYAHD